EASDAGQKSMEHLYQVMFGCSRAEGELMGRGLRRFEEIAGQEVFAAQTYDMEKAKALFDKFARNKTWQTPTLVMLRGQGNRKAFDYQIELVRRMNRAGVPILAGTDAPSPHIEPGFSLHDELQL